MPDMQSDGSIKGNNRRKSTKPLMSTVRSSAVYGIAIKMNIQCHGPSSGCPNITTTHEDHYLCLQFRRYRTSSTRQLSSRVSPSSGNSDIPSNYLDCMEVIYIPDNY
ncbi:hypothetical protein TNCV_500071 [Trichonephila clavipes]|nr:hypothetical protein TNCV_500071 [Trichonephila clavipes]